VLGERLEIARDQAVLARWRGLLFAHGMLKLIGPIGMIVASAMIA
jgi:hypothetical protein